MEMRIEASGTPTVPDFADCGLSRSLRSPDPVDWRFLFERERVRAEDAEARADAAEARSEELRWREVEARNRASSLETFLEKSRAKLDAAREEVREVRRTAKRALALEKEVTRLGRLLAEAGVDARKRSTVMSLRMENAALTAEVQELRDRVAALEARNDALRSSRSSMSRSAYGSKSEKGPRPSSKRGRGQQPGAPGHGRTPRPNLEETEERLDPPEDARICPCCGKPYVANGSHESEVVEIEVRAHKRRIVRPRWRRGCECASSPSEVTAPPPARLFPGTAFGTGVWAHVLHERFMCMRPCRRVADWLACQGLAVSPGTLADGTGRMLPLFEPIWDAVLARQNEAGLRHADETGWRIQALREIRKSRRAWLWTSVSHDAVLFHVDRTRSAAAAARLFSDAVGPVFLVCDRYSAYKKLARLLPAMIILCFCWAHARRDFLKCAEGRPRLAEWRDGWIDRIADIYRLNAVRLGCLDPDSGSPAKGFAAAQAGLEGAVAALFAEAERQLEELPETAPERKPLRSLARHREGLSVFLDHPEVPMDNNVGERAIRNPAIGRKLSFGSDSEAGARMTAVMYTVLGTVARNGLDVLRWLRAWLDACAENGGLPPGDLDPWLPWSMSEERRRAFAAPP